jgi:hypothetical protein
MTPATFRHLVTEVYGYSLVGFSKRMGMTEDMVRKMADGRRDVPEELRMLLEGETLEPAAPEYRDRRVRG